MAFSEDVGDSLIAKYGGNYGQHLRRRPSRTPATPTRLSATRERQPETDADRFEDRHGVDGVQMSAGTQAFMNETLPKLTDSAVEQAKAEGEIEQKKKGRPFEADREDVLQLLREYGDVYVVSLLCGLSESQVRRIQKAEEGNA